MIGVLLLHVCCMLGAHTLLSCDMPGALLRRALCMPVTCLGCTWYRLGACWSCLVHVCCICYCRVASCFLHARYMLATCLLHAWRQHIALSCHMSDVCLEQARCILCYMPDVQLVQPWYMLVHVWCSFLFFAYVWCLPATRLAYAAT